MKKFLQDGETWGQNAINAGALHNFQQIQFSALTDLESLK